jgi:hypothetical protein
MTWRRRLLAIFEPSGDPGTLLTALVGPDSKRGGWDVAWDSEGVVPARVRAETLTEVVEMAAAAAAELYARYPPNPHAELQLAIFPWQYPGGPMYDISNGRDGFLGHDLQDEAADIAGATLEDLVAAAEHTPEAGVDHCMFRWVRPVASLVTDASAPGPDTSQP